MKNRKMNVDRPPLESSEIQSGMNFGQLMVSYQAMSKPFYKTKWFFGTTGIASIGLIVGGTFAFQSVENSAVTMPSPPKIKEELIPIKSESESEEKRTELIAMNYSEPIAFPNEKSSEQTKVKTKQADDKIITPELKTETILKPTEEIVLTDSETPVVESNNQKKTISVIDLSPRINGKLDGAISREELFDNKGLTTNADVSIIHFELHLIGGLGSKVFEEESNQLNKEMKDAIKQVGQGETIYFEDIKGKTSNGEIVRLNPLRYVLLN